MTQEEKQALQITKEIVVKFIEIGRISPGTFSEYFSSIYSEVLRTISSNAGSTAQPHADDD